ncbi:Sec63 [Orbilia oligospora]|uniref:DNA 3'-5' helicase n=1 Tax=Orbilia oligospora TaxID=2813651 RepID=A0A7C8JMW0_ORBOL|nr:Sec63 [Orbilia oligospora]KAF3102416.1 Sec63 [Orbilia oligospora]
MSRPHIRDMDRELANSELSTEFRPLKVSSARPRQYYDISMFQDDADAEFNSVEIPPALAGSQSLTNSQITIEEQYSRDSSFSMGYHASRPSTAGPYQAPFLPSRRQGRFIASPHLGQQARLQEPMRPPSRLTVGPRTPPRLSTSQTDSTSHMKDSGTGTTSSAKQPVSFFDRFKHHSQINEPRTPVRVVQKQARHSSSSDEFELESSPTRSAMPPPSRQGTISYGFRRPGRNLPVSSQHAPLPPSHQGTTDYGSHRSGSTLPVLPQYAPLRPLPVASPRENPLNTLLKKPNHPARTQLPPMEDIEKILTPTQHEQTYSPRQVLSLSHAPTMAQGIQLIPIYSLPKKYHIVFPYKLFNATQSKCFDAVFNSNTNIVLSSPTGSGKTVVMELAICRLMETFEPGTFKIIYQAPTKALCAERKRDWEKKFASLGLKCTELTGDTQFNQLAEVKNGDLIVTTPEKWDSVTRRWADHKKLLGLVRLFLIDEVHILKEDRGATLEVVVSRMKTIGSRVRFVALSATVPNSKDIATWLGKDCDNPSIPAHEERFGEEFRPVKLEKVVYGYQANSNDFVFDKFLDQKLYEVIQKHSQRKPVMVFCATRNVCVSTAKILAEKWSSASGRERPWPAPLTNFSLRDRDLQLTGKSGVAFHHAGLEATDRTLIEKLFLEGHLSVICCTSTLAVGVNLPTRLVVIKNTVSWQGCQMREYLDLEVMQMVGRAGRPQFDTTGVAVIMTRKDKKDKYERMISGTEKLESCLHLNLIEHLNAEIGLGTITDIESAKQWLRSTFLYIRMKSNPAYYNFKVENIESEVESIMERDIDSLSEAGFVEWQQTKLKCLEPGDAMARYYIKFRTMKNIMELKEKAKVSEILTCLSEAEEFKEFRIRSGEKGVLKEINSSPSMKWSIKGDINSPAHKAYILIQFEIGCMEFPTTEGLQKYRATLFQDKYLIFQHLHRLVRSICDIKLFLRDSISCRNALELSRCIEAKVWENSPSMLLQLEGLGTVGVRKFVNNDIKTIDQLDALEAHKIETIASRNPPYGAKLKQDIAGIPRFRLYTQVTRIQANRKDPVKINFRAEIGVLNEQTPAKWHGKLLHLYFLVERSDGYLVDFRRMPILKLASNKDVMVQAELMEPGQVINCYIACEEIVNTSKSVGVEFEVQDSQFPPTKKEGPMSAFLKKRATMVAQNQEVIDLTERRGPIVNKPFKPPGRERNRASKDEIDEFEDEEFEKELLELDAISGNLGADTNTQRTTTSQPPRGSQQEPKPVPPPSWTPINNRESQSFSINHGSEDDLQLPPEEEDPEESNEPKQRPDGKWDCNHRCADKSVCRHLCCREGLDKRPKLKKKTAPKTSSTTKPIGSIQPTLAKTKGTESGSKTKSSQKQISKEPPQSKSSYCPLRKRVSDLVSEATSGASIVFIDLSKDDDSPASSFKGNGADSVRRLNELHAKCQKNKSIKIPKLPNPTSFYSSTEKPHVPQKRPAISDELEALLEDDEDFPTISELMEEEVRMKAGSINKGKGKETIEDLEEGLYGLKDDLLDSLDVYTVGTPEKDSKVEDKKDERSVFDILEHTPPKEDMRKRPKMTALQSSGTGGKDGGPEGIARGAVHEISSETLPPSPPPSSMKRAQETLVPSGPAKPAKRVRFDDEVLQDFSTRPSSKQNCNPVFITTSESNSEAGHGQGGIGDKMNNPEISMPPLHGRNEEGFNELEQEIMDFLGDCVVFV